MLDYMEVEVEAGRRMEKERESIWKIISHGRRVWGCSSGLVRAEMEGGKRKRGIK